MISTRSIPFFVAVFLSALLAACSVLGLDDDGAPVIPTEIVHDGLRFGLLSESAEEEWTLRAWAENVSDATIERTFPGGCMLTNIVTYREGEWRDPAWRMATIPGFGGCTTDALQVRIEPGEVIRPERWSVSLPVSYVLGDSLEGGRYRFGARTLQVGPGLDREERVSVELVAPEPLRLERCFDLPRPDSPLTPTDQLPHPVQVEQGGLQFQVRSELLGCGERWAMRVRATNVSDTTILADYPDACMITEMVVYREGEFAEPVWRAPDDSRQGLRCDETDVLGFVLDPGEVVEPANWRKSLRVSSILGDSLGPDYYRLRASIAVGGAESDVTARMMAPSALWLARPREAP